MGNKGQLLLIGGAEDREENYTRDEINIKERFEILKKILPENNKKGRIEVVTTASQVSSQIQSNYSKTFEEIGYHNYGFIDIESKLDAANNEYIQKLEKAQVIFFTGGDQLKLITILAGTPFTKKLSERFKNDSSFLIAGTSAGAMAMSKIMINGGGITEALVGTDIQLASGFGFLSDYIIDTHFVKRGRFSRLAHAIILNPGNYGLGLGENTALFIEGNTAECIGSGMIVFIDGHDITQTNISEVESGEPVYVENLKVNLLVRGCKLNLKSKQISYPNTKRNKK